MSLRIRARDMSLRISLRDIRVMILWWGFMQCLENESKVQCIPIGLVDSRSFLPEEVLV